MPNTNHKFYSLPMFPYPSGTAMHVGHVSNFMVNEIVARYRTMCGDDVIFPIGYDSFGLPTENYAIKNNKSAHAATAENIKYYNEQLKAIDFAFDQDRMFATSDPEYYRWTQRIFTKLYQHNLVYRRDGLVNWCNGCQTVLANDQVVDGRCERCETEIIQKKHPQRYIKITDYADQLLDYADCDRPEETKIHQKNWIGKSHGTQADFLIEGTDHKITVFTTRIDTIYGVTAIVLAPENETIDQYMADVKKSELANYRTTTQAKTNIERQATNKEKTGFDSGVQVTHPLSGERVPVWFADYVLPDYATGAVMFVPAHDERDDQFAGKYGISIKIVIVPEQGQESNEFCYTGSGVLINSDQFNGLDNITAKNEIAKHLESIGMGHIKTTYRLRDWSVSRQRYWGSPIPVYYTFEDNIQVPYFEWNKKEGASYTTRKGARAIIKHPTQDLYCFIKNNDGIVTIGGGVEQRESYIDAASREIIEETGYDDFILRNLDTEYHYVYYKPKHDINYYYTSQLFYCELKSLFQREHEEHEGSIEWLTIEEIRNQNDIALDFYIDIALGLESKLKTTIDRYNAHNPHPDKTKRIPNLIPESDLPVILPLDLPNYKPAGKSPLEDHPSFKYYHAPDGQVYLRECDTLDTFMCSSFYFLRFCDPHNEQELISTEAAKLMPVDLYVGGKEHTVGHLLYSRFIYKFLQDQGYIACESKEPFRKLVHQGMVHAHDGRKMSKRWGNVVDPMTIVNEYGSDTLRTYTMFMGPVEASKNWNPDAVAGVHRFMTKIERLADSVSSGGGTTKDPLDSSSSLHSVSEGQGDLISLTHQTIQGITEDIELLKFNTVVSKLMILSNAFQDIVKAGGNIDKELFIIFIKLLAPFATKLSDQLWSKLGQEGSIHNSSWPDYDESLMITGSIDLPIQINGKMRGTITMSPGFTQDQAMELAHQHDNIAKRLSQGQIIKIIYIQDKICNIIVK